MKSKVLFPLLAASILLVAAGCNKSTPAPAMQNDQGMQQNQNSAGNSGDTMMNDQKPDSSNAMPSGSMPTKDNAGSMSTDGSMPNNK